MVQANFLREPQFSLRTQWERIFSLFSFRAFCSTWQGLSALPHTRVWQSSGWPCQQLQGCLALSDESVGNLVQYCIGFNLVQYCTGFNLVQYCFVLILKFFPNKFTSMSSCQVPYWICRFGISQSLSWMWECSVTQRIRPCTVPIILYQSQINPLLKSPSK